MTSPHTQVEAILHFYFNQCEADKVLDRSRSKRDFKKFSGKDYGTHDLNQRYWRRRAPHLFVILYVFLKSEYLSSLISYLAIENLFDIEIKSIIIIDNEIRNIYIILYKFNISDCRS